MRNTHLTSPATSLVAILAVLVALTGCTKQSHQQTAQPQDKFFDHLSSLCGQSFAGKLISSDEVDADFAAKKMVMEVRTCSDTVIRIPFHVDDDHSRTWVISKTENGLRLKHDHRHEDGSEDVLTQYGGDTGEQGTENKQAFPADDFSKQLFTREEIPVSVDNVWNVEIIPGKTYTYGLARPSRDFRVEFDLTTKVAPPPAPWGQ